MYVTRWCTGEYKRMNQVHYGIANENGQVKLTLPTLLVCNIMVNNTNSNLQLYLIYTYMYYKQNTKCKWNKHFTLPPISASPRALLKRMLRGTLSVCKRKPLTSLRSCDPGDICHTRTLPSPLMLRIWEQGEVIECTVTLPSLIKTSLGTTQYAFLIVELW